MKFDKGHWELLPDTKATYLVTVAEVQIQDDALVVRGYDRPIYHRGDTLHGAAITVRFTSPLPDVIRVQLTHFKGRRPRQPAFDLDYTLSNPDAELGRDETHAWLKSGDLSVVVPVAGQWRLDIQRDGAPLTSSEPNAIGLFDQAGQTYLREQLSLGVGETVYGLGERFGHFVKNGQAVQIWNEDGGTDSEYAYKAVPFYVTNAGYGVLVNHPGRVEFEVGSHHTQRVQFSAAGHSLDYYFCGGPTIKDVLTQYTALSGRPALPPEWSFGLWLTTSFTTDYNEATIIANIERMAGEGCPVTVFHFDCFWMKPFTWTSLVWDEEFFPAPARMLKNIKSKGVKICVWINPYIAEASTLFDEGLANDYFLKTPEGDVYQEDKWQPGLAYVDFTNPAARQWYGDKLRELVAMGVDCFKTDFGEWIPTEVVYHNGADPERMHNYYSYLYNQTVWDVLQATTGEPVLFARSATTGGQRFPVHWGGNNSSTYPSMAETLRGGLSLGLCGFGFWSHDISGFIGTATPDLYKRWVAFGMLSSHSRLHGMDSARMPWLFDEEAVDVLQHFMNVKQHLMPYLMDVARQANASGWPMLRAMVMEFPDDPACRYLDTQYMLGPALLVAPIFNDQGHAHYYLPAGEWQHLLSGETAWGPGWQEDTHDYFSQPLWVNVARAEGWECLKGYRYGKPRATFDPTAD